MQLDAQGWMDPVPSKGARGTERGAETASALLAGLWLGPAAIVLVDAELRIASVNGAFARLAGSPAETIAGCAVRDLFPGEPLAFAVEDRLRAVMDSGEAAIDLSASSRGRDGVTRWWRASLYPVVAASGEVRAVCALVDETTALHDRERALERERAAAERNARRLGLLQKVTAAVAAAAEPAEIGRAVIDSVSAFAGADAASIRVLEPEGLVTLAWAGVRVPSAWVAETVSPSAPTPSSDALRSQGGVWLESSDEAAAHYPHLHAAGRAEGWQSGAALALRASGRAIGTLSLAFRTPHAFDLEERALLLAVAEQCALALDRARALERERAERERADRDRAVLDAVLGNAPVGILLLDRELRFLHVNPAVAALTGVPLEAHAGRTPHELLPFLPWDDQMQPMLRGVLETGAPCVEVPVEAPFPDGRVRHFLGSAYRVQTGDTPIGVGAIVRDVTAEREAEQLHHNVLGIVGHDLRTPLATVTTSAYLLQRGDALGERQARLVGRIAAASARIQQVIGILLDYARTSGGRTLPVRRRACDVGALCRAVADEAEGARPGRTVRCHGEGERGCDWDPDRIEQALANLVSNALEHGAPDAPVTVRWRGGAEQVAIEVTNAGAPIPPDLLPRIFDAFRSGRRERGGGLGLGLFIGRAIAVAHGGAIDVRSRDGETTFTLRLPRRAPEPRG